MKLFEPITIRQMILKNRILMSSMGVGLGLTNDRAKNFYIERARGGVGAISIGAGIPGLFFSDETWGKTGAVKKFIARMKPVTEEIRQAGAKIGIQFYHGNRYPFSLDPDAGDLVAPSARVEPYPTRSAWVNSGESLRELSPEEIKDIIDTFGKAAAGAKEAGFDFVEIHNAHGLLPCQFFSPVTNQREDQYGGDLKGRMRFGLECVRTMREAVGEDYPLFARHGAKDAVPGGYDFEEGIAFGNKLIEAGIDVLNVSIGTPPFQGGYIPGGEDPEGTHVEKAVAVKGRVNAPVVAVGRVKSPEFAESILTQEKADIIALGRQLLVDPYWPKKAAERKSDEIIPCIDCHECYKSIMTREGVECTVNYSVSRESDSALQKTTAPKRVLVVGGGPAGMEAASTASARGHQVTLWEKGNQLGGAMILQAMIPSKDPVENLVRYMKRKLYETGVKVELGKTAAPESIKMNKPDVVILAPGGKPFLPDIQGINRENVINSYYLREMMYGGPKSNGHRIRAGWRSILIRLGSVLLSRPWSLSFRNKLADIGIPIIFGKRVVVLGSDMTSCQLADFLSDKGRSVCVAASEMELAKDLPSTLRLRLLGRLEKKGVSIFKGVKKYEQITDSELVILDQNGDRQTIAADSFIPVFEQNETTQPEQAWMDTAPEVYIAGDYASPLKLFHAVHSGAKLGREI